MSVIRLNNRFYQKLRSCRYSSTVTRLEEEYTSTPNYPPILDLSPEKKRERMKDESYDQIKAVKTVEEKQIKLNMPKYYGFKSYMLLENKCGYNMLPMTQHATRTHLVVNKGLPDYYKEFNVDELANKLKSEVEEALSIEIDGYQRLHDLTNEALEKEDLEDIVSSSLIKRINRIIMNELSLDLQDTQVDIEPRIEASWNVGGIVPPSSVVNSRKGVPWLKDRIDEPTDRVMVYKGVPILTLRSKLPLKSVIPLSESENPDLDVPVFDCDPRTIGTTTEYRHMTNIPGFWPGDPHTFGLLSYHKRGYMHLRKDRYNDLNDDQEAIHRQGILTAFGWLMAQAHYLGFNTFNDLTYPLVTQTVVTNGKTWSFYTYQMNTTMLCERFFKSNPRRNICWATDQMDLFEDIADGKLIGFNDEVLKNLLKFYLNRPESPLGINLTPYLSNEEKLCSDYEDDHKRKWLEDMFKFLMSNRPRHKLVYEIYAWEKIYKIDNKTRFMDKRLRPFELFQHPYQRRLDETCPRYIPKKFREDVKRVKGGSYRFEKTYYP
ncbi:unnamed protein product [Phyllotreta striolata]|uniref:28S ribosomal protein S30, mitochondrial n=1 Tax=Phyllotreta striolata TaxID=444603 RepID=A0A9N9TIG0_PHYSR|nr:unnamed protein product [Phyllotreta striolata]